MTDWPLEFDLAAAINTAWGSLVSVLVAALFFRLASRQLIREAKELRRQSAMLGMYMQNEAHGGNSTLRFSKHGIDGLDVRIGLTGNTATGSPGSVATAMAAAHAPRIVTGSPNEPKG
jgi:uncharacterized membrane protein YccC